MPDGFNPHTELDRIHSLRELISECRARVPKVLGILDGLIEQANQTYVDDNGNERPALTAGEKMALSEMIFNRAYGKPRQHVTVSDQTDSPQVKAYIPANNREKMPTGRVFDVEESQSS